MLWSVFALGKHEGEGGQVSQKLNSCISFGFIISRGFTCSQADTHKTHGLCVRCASPCMCVICVLEENKESSCGSCPEGAYAPAHGFPSSLSRVGGSGSSAGGRVRIHWIRNQLVRELKGELILLNEQSQGPYFCCRRWVYLFFYCRVGKDQLEDRFCIFHFGLSVKKNFSFFAICRWS